MASSFDPSQVPSSPPPPGEVSNFAAPVYNPGTIAGANGLMLVVATIAFLARMFTTEFVIKKVHIEDYSLTLGWAVFVALQGCTFAQLAGDLGRHQYDVSKSGLIPFMQFVDYSQILYSFCLLFIKSAILLQIKRIFRGISKDSVYWSALVMIALNLVFYVYMVIQFGICEPSSGDPSLTQPPKVCLYSFEFVIASGAFNLVLDVLVLVLPIYAIWRLKLPIQRKLSTAAVFAIGTLACVASALRLYYSLALPSQMDITFEIVNFLWTSCLECTSAILVASFPVMPRLYKYLKEKKTGSSKEKSTTPRRKFDARANDDSSIAGFGRPGSIRDMTEHAGSQTRSGSDGIHSTSDNQITQSSSAEHDWSEDYRIPTTGQQERNQNDLPKVHTVKTDFDSRGAMRNPAQDLSALSQLEEG